jgi:hypothetical protein
VKSVFTALHAELHRIRHLRRNPAEDCHKFQMRVLSMILAAEKRVRKRKARIHADQLLLAGRSGRLSKADSLEVKRRIQGHHDAIARARWQLKTARTLVDALAFLFLPKWDMKPLAWKESPGFISGKRGLRLELQLLRIIAIRSRHVAILNDLTHCLRYAVNGERRSFALLRPVADATAHDHVRDLILQAYSEHESQHEAASR